MQINVRKEITVLDPDSKWESPPAICFHDSDNNFYLVHLTIAQLLNLYSACGVVLQTIDHGVV